MIGRRAGIVRLVGAFRITRFVILCVAFLLRHCNTMHSNNIENNFSSFYNTPTLFKSSVSKFNPQSFRNILNCWILTEKVVHFLILFLRCRLLLRTFILRSSLWFLRRRLFLRIFILFLVLRSAFVCIVVWSIFIYLAGFIYAFKFLLFASLWFLWTFR